MRDVELPEGWIWSKIGDICDVNPRSWDHPPEGDDDRISFVPMAAVKAGGGSLDATKTKLYGEARRKSLTKFQEGDVLFAKITPCMENGKISVAAGLRNGIGVGSTEFHVLRPLCRVSAHYLAYYLLQEPIRREAERNMSGAAGQRRVPKGHLANIEVPLPPLTEQNRIVDALEMRLSKIDNATTTLKEPSKKIESLNKSVLFHLIPDQLPSSWHLITVGEAGRVELGRQRHPDWHHGPEMRPYLRVANVFENRIDTSDIMEMDFSGVFDKYRLKPNDLLLNEGQSPHLVGRPAIYRGDPPDAAFTNSLLRFRARSDVLPEWALLVFRRHMHSGRFMREARITTNIAHLSAKRLKSIEFPTPSIDTQKRIIEKFAQAASNADALDLATRKGIARAERLRRALFEEAFSGRLAPQDPSDEPVSVLLERIRAERTTQTPATTKRRSTRSPRTKPAVATEPPTTSTPAPTTTVQQELPL